MASNIKIGGVYAELALKDTGFRSGLKNAAQNLRETSAATKFAASDVKQLGGALAGTFGGGALAKISPVVDLVGAVGPKALAAAPMLGPIGVALGAVGAAAYGAYSVWKTAQDEANARMLAGLELLDTQRDRLAALARSNVSQSETAKAARGAKAALSTADADSASFAAALASRIADVDARLATSSERIASGLALRISELRKSAAEAIANGGAADEINAAASREIARITAVANVETARAEKAAALERTAAASGLADDSTRKRLEEAAASVEKLRAGAKALEADVRKAFSRTSELSALELWDTEGGLAKGLADLERKVGELRKTRADAANENKLATDLELAELQSAIAKTIELQRAREALAEQSRRIADLTAKNEAARAAAAERAEVLREREAVASAKLAAAQNEAATAAAEATAEQAKQALALAKTESAVTKLGESWRKISASRLSAGDIAGGSGASSNEERARRAVALRAQAEQAEREGRFARSDALAKRAASIEGRLVARDRLSPEDAAAAKAQRQALEATERARRLMSASVAESAKNPARAAELRTEAEGIADRLRKAGFGSAALDRIGGGTDHAKRSAEALDEIGETLKQLRELVAVS